MTERTREEEARAALKRLDEQSEKFLGTGPPQQEPEDDVERLAKRIGRILSVALFVALAVYLWRTYFSG